MPMRIRLTNRVGLHFGLVLRRPMRITRLPSALEVSHAGSSWYAEITEFCFLIFSFYVRSGDSTSPDEGCIYASSDVLLCVHTYSELGFLSPKHKSNVSDKRRNPQPRPQVRRNETGAMTRKVMGIERQCHNGGWD
jgi:hypothetical protein